MKNFLMTSISLMVIALAVAYGSVPMFVIGFAMSALAGGGSPSPVLSMAVVKGMNFKRGRLGDIAFRQQVVNRGNGQYGRETVAFRLPETVSNPRTSGQVRQRTKFRLIQQIATALASKGITYNFYRSGRGLSGYNAFIRDNLRDGIYEAADGTPFVDWKKMTAVRGDFAKEIKVFESDLTAGRDYDESCNCARKLVWNYDWTCDPNGDSYALNLIGIKVDEEGAIEDVLCVQPRTPMSACATDVVLPKCNCCKTYWYAFFVDPYTGYFSSSSYIGTCDCKLEKYDGCCDTCETAPVLPVAEPPSECPENCCGDEKGIKSEDIVYSGQSKVPSGYGGTTLIYGACPLLTVTASTVTTTTYLWKPDGDHLGLVCVMDNNGILVAEWETTFVTGFADYGENGNAIAALEAAGMIASFDADNETLSIISPDGRKLRDFIYKNADGKQLGVNQASEVIETTEIVFGSSPIDQIANMVVTDSNGETHFDGLPSTLENGFLIIPDEFDGDPATISVVLSPTDTACPSATVEYYWDGEVLTLANPDTEIPDGFEAGDEGNGEPNEQGAK